MIRVTLVSCYGDPQPPNAEPLAIEVLAGAVEARFPAGEVQVSLHILDKTDDPQGELLAEALSRQPEPAVVGVSCPQGTYQLSLDFLNAMQKRGLKPLVLLGHALPEYSFARYLELYPQAVIVVGWGEEALCAILAQVQQGTRNWQAVSNLIYRGTGGTPVHTANAWPRPATAPKRMDPPQYFTRVETSRGCHYDRCTFCVRPARSAEEKGPLWFRFPLDLIRQQLVELKKLHVQEFTYADEDFIGSDLEGALAIGRLLEELNCFKFSIAVRVDNVFCSRDSSQQAALRSEIFNQLKKSGLSLVFMGVESLSASQLLRYGKGISIQDSFKAIQRIRQLNTALELGFILFDPLLSMDELRENFENLQVNDHWNFVGQLFNHMRLQDGTRYLRMGKVSGLLKAYDPEMMEFSYEFSDPGIQQIARVCLGWKQAIDPVYSLARNIQRTTFDGDPASQFVRDYRQLQMDILASLLKIGAHPAYAIQGSLLARGKECVRRLAEAVQAFPIPTSTERRLLVQAGIYLNGSGE